MPACSDLVDGSARRQAAWHALRAGVPELLEALDQIRTAIAYPCSDADAVLDEIRLILAEHPQGGAP